MKPAIRPLILVLLICWAGTLPAGPSKHEYSEVIAFGDSLADPGNAFVLTGEQTVQPFPVIPGAPYAIGGHHFSNGSTFVEQLGRELRLQRSTGPAWKNARVFSNYAVGGSRARAGVSTVSATTQVMQFLSDRGQAPSDALYSFTFGGNDVRDALAAGGDPTIIGDAVMAIAGNLIALCQAGARDIVVANVANVGVTPAVRALDQVMPGAAAGATALSAGFNLALNDALTNAVQPSCPMGTTLYVLDVFTLVTAIDSDPGAFGFVDTVPCLTFDVVGRAICRRPNTKFFWDGIHPTKAGHAVFTDAILDLISGP